MFAVAQTRETVLRFVWHILRMVHAEMPYFLPFAPWPPSGHVSVSDEMSALSQASYRQGKSPVPRIKTTLTPDWVR